MKTNIGTWAAFILVSVASLVTYKTAWATSFYWVLLSCLAVVAVIMGLVVLRQTGLKPWPLVLVIGGLLAGQWWLIQLLLIIAFGKLRGFAP